MLNLVNIYFKKKLDVIIKTCTFVLLEGGE